MSRPKGVPNKPKPLMGEEVVTSTQALVETEVVSSMEQPVITPMFQTYDDPDELASRFVFKGGPQLQLTAEFKDPDFRKKWFPYFAYDQNGDGSTLAHKLSQSYVFVTQDEVFNVNNSVVPGNKSLDNRVKITGRNGDVHYLMKCPRSVAEKIWASEEALRLERDAQMRAGKTPDGTGLSEQDGRFTPSGGIHKSTGLVAH